MIFDCFTFFNEFSLLEIRLETLWEHVDYFVLVEMAYTHSNLSKPYYFEENKEQFAKYMSKIIHVKVPDLCGPNGSWALEHYQRNCIVRGLEKCQDDDIIFISDVDEIPNPKYFDKLKLLYPTESRKTAYASIMFISILYYYKFNIRETSHSILDCPKAVLYKTLKESTPDRIRRSYDGHEIPEGAWHFSFVGNIEKIKTKIRSFCHQEFNKPEFLDDKILEERIENGLDLFGRGFGFSVVKLDDSYPSIIYNNQERFAEFIKNENLAA